MSLIGYWLQQGDCREVLAGMRAGCAQTCVTSPPYWRLRDYGVAGQFGLEDSPEEYVERLVEVFRSLRRVLRDDGTLWLNLGDSYIGAGGGGQGAWGAMANRSVSKTGANRTRGKRADGLKPKDLVGIPWRVAFALQADGWWLRSDIVWAKPNPMPESVTDRPTRAHEYVFLFAKSERYLYDAEACAERAVSRAPIGNGFARTERISHDGRGQAARWMPTETRNRRSVWSIHTHPFPEAHFATFPEDLVLPCILAGSRPGDVVLDPFSGAGTTGVVALKQGRHYLGIELNPEYLEMSRRRLESVSPLLTTERAS